LSLASDERSVEEILKPYIFSALGEQPNSNKSEFII
jgi:hypothetical protein